MALQSVRDGDNRYKVLGDNGRTVGFVHKWYQPDPRNGTGIPRFRAVPLGQPECNHCESLSSAMAYLAAFE